MDLSQPSRVWSFAGCRLDERALELKVGGQIVEIDRKPLEVLLHLLRHAGELVTKDELAEAVWPGRIITDSNLTKTVAVLRAALGDAGPAAIKTVHGYGYRLVAPVSVQVPATDQAPPRLALQVGDSPPLRPQYELVSRLGSGGQGEVWLARDRATGEPRVFKFAEAGRALTALKREITLNRLLRETLPERRDFLRVLGWNVEEPPFFIESEQVPLGNLAAWAESRGGWPAIAPDLRLELVAQVAEALAAAHSVGVLHKDLKPANVLVEERDGQAHIKLADFGSGGVLAPAALEGHGITRMGFTQTVHTGSDTSGTPLYLAPEVIAGQPFTVQSDIYALGVMLYQLVAGDLRRALAPGWEKDVPDELLREDIAAAAAGDPAERLGDALAVAQRLRSLAQRRAERAAGRAREAELQRASRMREQVRRLRAVAAVLLVAMAGTAAAGLYALRARDEARRAAAEAEAVTQFLNTDLLAGADPRQGPQADLTVLGLLDRATRSMDERFAGQPTVAARLHVQLGETYLQMGELERSRQHLEAAIGLYGPESDDAQQTRLHLARNRSAAGDHVRACTLIQEVMAFVTGHPAAGDDLRLGARTNALVCDMTHGRTDVAEARAIVAEFERRGLTGSRWYERALRGVTENLTANRAFADAEVQARKVVAYLGQAYGPRHLRTSRERVTLAEVLLNLGKLDEADAELSRALEDLVAWGGGVEKLHGVYARIALLREEQGRFAEAEAAARQELDGPMGKGLTGLWPVLMEAVLQQGRLEEIVAQAPAAVALCRERSGALQWYQVSVVAHWADALRRLGRTAEAWRVLDSLAPAEQGAVNDDNRHLFDRVRALLLAHDGKRAEARALLEAVLKAQDTEPGATGWRIVRLRRELQDLRSP